MKKLFLLTKTLLVAVMLCVGANAWAADTFLPTWTGMVGTATNSGNFKYATKKINIAAGETYVYTLTNFNDGNVSNYWKNWVVEGNLDTKYFDCEARGNQWNAGDGPTPSYTPVMAYTDVENFQTAYNGATVTITISRNAAGDQFTVTHTSNVKGTTDGNTDKYYGGTWTVAVGAEENWDIYITEEEAHFVVTNVTYTDAESNVTNYTPLYQRGYTTAWSAGDIGTGNWTGSTSYAEISNGLKISNNQNSNANQSITNNSFTSPTANSTLTYDIIWDNGADGSHNDHYIYLTVGNNIQFRAYHQAQKGEVIIGSNTISIPNACNNTNGNRNNDIWTIHMVVNTASNNVTELTINGTLGKTKVNYTLDAEKYAGNDATFSSLTLGWYRVNYRPSYNTTLKSVIISEKLSELVYADYTVHFVDNNSDEVKADEVRSGVVGNTVEALDADKENIYIGENRYVYSTDGGGVEVTNDGSAEFTITYTKSTKEAYSVMAQVSGVDLAEIASGTAFFDEGSTTAYWSKYINEGGSWYETTTYGSAITKATTNIAFTAASIDYFYEFEDMTLSRIYGDGYTGTWASNGRAITLYGGANGMTESTVAAGVYTISLNGKQWQSGYSDVYEVAYSTDKTNWIPVGNITYPDGEEGVKTLAGAIIPVASYIRIRATMGSQTPRWYLDYLTLKKTADIPTTENIVVTSAGYATYVSNYNLDFSSATTKAYKVNVADKAIATLTEVSKVPAKTPVLLYVAGGNGSGEAIPVTTDAVSAVSGNNLVAGAGVAVAYDNGDGKYNYVLDNQDDVVGFYKAAGLTVPVGRAYLQTAYNVEGAGARGLRMVFAGDITGINEAKAEAAAQKDGKFVINGQLVIKKNGKMFNAAGVQMK